MTKVNVGVIGLGVVGERLIKQFIANPNTEVVAISDVNEQRMVEVRKTIVDATPYINHKDLIADQSVELVYVAVPPKFHHAIILDVLEARKHVLCEKPLANSFEEAKEMTEKVKSAGVINAMNFPLPYSKAAQLLDEKIQKNDIGNIKRIEFKMHFPAWPREWQQNPWIAGREQGGFIREIMPHYIQLIHQVFGNVKNVNVFIEYPENEALCETGVIARMELEDGTPILINGLSGIGEKEEISFNVYGEKGVLSLSNWVTLTYSSLKEDECILVRGDREKSTPLIDEIVNAFAGKPAHLVTFEEGFQVQKILEKLLDN